MLRQLQALPLPCYLASISALDRYFHRPFGQNLYVAVRGSLVDLARMHDTLEYPGVDEWDAALPNGEGYIYFRCVEEDAEYAGFGYAVLDMLFEPRTETFFDRADAYHQLRSARLSARNPDDDASFWEGAVLSARYGYDVERVSPPCVSVMRTLSAAAQRRQLIDVLCGSFAWKGLQILMDGGAVHALWPELQPMNGTVHSKEEHPEGNVWQHSLETLRYRKSTDLTLTMALLLHDSGKPHARRTRERAFDQHAELGTRTAVSLLRRLQFSRQFIDNVTWLIRNHMLPGNLHRLPTYRSEKAMASPLFPLLLELYRCDLCSTYRGPDGYYRACKVYRSFLKNRANPFRAVDGKKLLRLYVE
ncbi:MAG: HD domain-containing protein [Spirochaetaceae bacterium]|nr:MAG: HD domain-containing protein [Spirochaetaceae bacterium]